MALPVSAQRFEIGRTVNRTFAAIGTNFFTFLLLAVLLAAIPMVIITLGYAYLINYLIADASLDPLILGSVLPFAVAAVLMIPTYVLIGALTHGSIMHYAGARARFGECLATGFRFLLPLVGLGILTAIGLFLWFLLFMFPGTFVVGIIGAGMATTFAAGAGALVGGALMAVAAIPVILAIIRWSVSAPSLVVEKSSILAAFKRSIDLTRNNRWKIFFLGLVYVVISFLIQSGITFLATSVVSGMDVYYGVLPWVLYGFQVLYSAINSMILASGQTALYYELRVSKEGATSDELAKVFE